MGTALSRRKAVGEDDAREVYEPLYAELVKNREQILSSEKSGPIPMFDRNKIEEIRIGARYSQLKGQIPSVERLCKSMDIILANQGNAHKSAARIIGETIRSRLKYDGSNISFVGKTTEGGSPVNIPSAWISGLLIRARDPLAY